MINVNARGCAYLGRKCRLARHVTQTVTFMPKIMRDWVDVLMPGESGRRGASDGERWRLTGKEGAAYALL